MHFVYPKILLVNPGRDDIFSPNEPLNLALLASFLEREGVEVMIADQLSGEDVRHKYTYFKPDIVGITSTTPLINDAYNIADCFRGKVPIVLGGVHATTFPEEGLARVDMVVRGEGEYALRDILTKGHKRGIFSSDRLVDINKTPLPARHLLNNEYYLNTRRKFPQDGWFLFVPWHAKLLSVMISRGCPWNCAFCHNVWRGMPFRIYNPERVVAELVRLERDFGLKYFIFRDDNIFSSKKRIKQILQAIINGQLKLKWGANARVDSLDDEIIDLAKQAGCRKLNFGFESGSQRLLNQLNKMTTIKKAMQTVRLCRKHKIQVSGSFIVGHPDENISDVITTQKMIRKLKLDSIGVAMATPFPGTQWWQLAEAKGLIPPEIDWRKFDFDHIPIKLNRHFSDQDLKKIQRGYYREAARSNLKYLVKMMSSFLINPNTFKKRVCNILGLS